jgi:hypothetical protein
MSDALKTQAHDLVVAYYKESLLNVDTVRYGNLAQLTSAEAIRTASEPLKAEILQNTFIDPATLLPTFTSTLTPNERNTLFHTRIPLVHMLLTYPLPYTAEIIHGLVEYVKQNYFISKHPETLIRVFSSLDPALFAAIKPSLLALRDAMTNEYRDGTFHKDTRTMIYNIDTLLRGPQQGPVRILIDDWGALVLDIYDAMPDEIKQPWAALLDHVQRGAGSKNLPSAKWLAQTPALIEALGQAQFVQVATAWLNAFGQHRGMRPAEANGNLLRGLTWLCATVPDRALAAALADAAIEGYRKISGQGPRSPKISSACVYALQAMPNLYGAAQLERVRLNVKQSSYKKEIEKALNALAQRAQLSREDLEELTLPDYGFVDGVLRVHFGCAGYSEYPF